MMFVWSMVVGLLFGGMMWVIGFVMVVMVVVIVWGCVYVGVYWLFDMVGGVLVGMVGVLVVYLYG